MAWYDEAFFYHIYPLGLCGAPKTNPYEEGPARLRTLWPWVDHLKELGVTALYIGPLFESGSHGYDTSDYRKLDSRLGSNGDLKDFVAYCHESGIRVVLDAVFNHSGRDFFAFRDLREKREQSPYRDWYCNVNFRNNNEYNDGFSYDNWGGYNLLAKFNLRNPQVVNYHLDTVRRWVSEFDIDGLRLDTADVLDFDFMRALRGLANSIKPEFWLMGEVIHGEYQRWVNPQTLHAVTDYPLHKALYSGHNDHNYFEIAHTLNRFIQNGIDCRSLYSFADNHDVERIHTKLRDRRHWTPVHILLFCLPGIPSVYYGSEFGIDGRKERRGSDDEIRPALDLAKLREGDNDCLELVRALGRVYREEKALAWGDYEQLLLTTTQYVFRRGDVIVAVNNDGGEAVVSVPCGEGSYRGALHGERFRAENGRLSLRLAPCDGEILIPESRSGTEYEPIRSGAESREENSAPAAAAIRNEQSPAADSLRAVQPDLSKPYDEMSVEELQAAILQKLAKNGPVTDRMRRDVAENVYRNSLLNWVRSFR
ncbi:MAG: alpha-amylase [Oscillospiraceae bacterium]|nr:alpha-amylase [Oscillospiraceae bacterium]